MESIDQALGREQPQAVEGGKSGEEAEWKKRPTSAFVTELIGHVKRGVRASKALPDPEGLSLNSW